MKTLMKTAATVLFALAFLTAQPVYAQNDETTLIETIAGVGNIGIQDGEEASFNMPAGIMVLPSGEILVADTFNNLLRQVDRYGFTSTFAGYIAEFFPMGFHRDRELNEAGLHHPTSLAMCLHRRIYFTEPGNNSIRVVIGNNVYTLVGWGEAGFADGPRGTAAFNGPTAIAFGPSGYLYVADTLNHVVRRVSLAGYTTTIAGTPGEYGYENGQAGATLFDSPSGIVIAPDGRIFVADTGNHVIRVIENGTVSTYAGSHVLSEDDHYAIGGFADGPGSDALFNQPRGLAMWGDYLKVADTANHSIRMISPEGYVTTVFGTALTGYEPATLHFPMGIYVHENRLYIADTGNNRILVILLQD